MTVAHALASLPGWTPWRRYVDASGHERKLPLHVDADRIASVQDTGSASLAQALAARQDRHAGVGLFINHSRTGILCIDLDSCYDPTIPKLTSWAIDILKCINSYTEVSPSGHGVKTFVRSPLPKGFGGKAYHRQLDVEAVSRSKSPSISVLINSYATITGNHLATYSCDVESRDLTGWISRFMPQSRVGGLPAVASQHPTATKRNPAGSTPGSLSEAVRRIKRANYPVPQVDGSRLLYFIVALAALDWRYGDARIVKLLHFWQSRSGIPIPLLECSEANYHIRRTITSVRAKFPQDIRPVNVAAENQNPESVPS